MGNRILGLDISQNGVKAVQITAELTGKYRITALADYDIRETRNILEAVKRIREDARFRDNICVTSLAADTLSFRNLKMPFKSRRKIRQTLNFELEPLIPYAIEEVVTDFLIMEPFHLQSDSADNSLTDLFVIAAPKEAIRDRIEELAPLRVPIIEVETVPAALSLISAGYSRDFYILLDIGAKETVAVFFRNGVIFHIRSFAFGGNTITEAVSRSLGLDFDQAEEKKKTGQIAGADQEVAEACQKFCAELSHTLHYLNQRGSDEKPSKLIVTGGGAMGNLFNRELGNYFSVPVEKLDVRAFKHVSVPTEMMDSWDAMRMNNALALALRGSLKTENGFNFKKDEFTGAERLLVDFKANIRKIAAVLVIVFGIAVIDSGAGFYIDKRRLANLKSEITNILKKSSPDITRVVDPVQQMKTKVNEAEKFSMGATDRSVLDLLKSISETIPPSTEFLITDLNYDGEKIEIRGETADFDSVETIKREIARSGTFKNITVSGANLIKEKNKVEFELRMSCAR
jgi:type IV pilus assembly protein PilM